MHELGVVFHVIEEVEGIAKENGVDHINAVTLEIGEVSGIVHQYLIDVWDWAVSKHEVMKGCKLKIETIQAITFCENCEKTYTTIPYGKICPHCKSEKTYLQQGNEFLIKEMEVI